MPIYEYKCEECGRQLELLVSAERQPQCPECESRKLTRLLSIVAAPSRTAGGERSGSSPGPCGGSCACHPHG
jgi:putative FmdB family regulatory protein